MQQIHTLIIADDHQVVIEGVRVMLEDETNFELVGSARSIPEVFSVIAEKKPSLALLDLNMNGQNMLDSIEDLKKRFPKLKTIIMSSYNEPTLVNLARSKGMDGYILKNTNKSDLLHILEKVLNGGTYFIKKINPRFGPTILRSTMETKDKFLEKELLSAREIEIIQLVTKGKTEQQMAKELHISKHTVHTHRKKMMKRLGLHSAVDIVRYAYENGLVRGEY